MPEQKKKAPKKARLENLAEQRQEANGHEEDAEIDIKEDAADSGY
jgi:hypothetical protein